MHILLSRYQLHLPMVESLKAKRSITRRITSTLRNNYNVSVAEIGAPDACDCLDLAVVVVSATRTDVERTERTVSDTLDMDPDARLGQVDHEWL